MQDHYEEIRNLGGEVVVVSFTAPELVQLHTDKNQPPFPIVSDMSRAGYHAFGLERMPATRLLRPGFVWRVLRLMLRGRMPQRQHPGDDVWQLGGDFVLDAERRVVLAYRSEEPTDRPSVQQLLEAVRKARGAGAASAS